jgi:NADH-quinone oxidoreductase subunit L
MADWLWLIPLFPLAGAILCGILYAAGKGRLAGPIATLAAALSCAAGILAFRELLGGRDALLFHGFTWIQAGQLQLSFDLRLDHLSGIMVLVVTGIGTLIHLYSIGYMHGDPGVGKFFAYLNLFLFAMSTLVLGDNLPLLFVGWEGVGAMSYLLIGFWYDRENGWPAMAGQKAFIANRVGDLGFLLGMFVLFTLTGTLSIDGLQKAGLVEGGMLTVACLLLFLGATGKSAQIPLFVWLPDAMAGPTPVSALIHAATMVTAGVYMVCRLSFLFVHSPVAMAVMAVVGAATALFAATLGLAQRDIKKVLAYSTVSQLGYMFLACGVGAFSAAIFHVFTHAFFKALLFLGAGSVIHGMHHEQNALKMGGLGRHMKITGATFLLGSLALAGFPLTSGFFSKDEILFETVTSGITLGGVPLGSVLWGVGAVTALLTAFYTFRLYALVFCGKERFDHHEVHPHESPLVMTLPLMILAVGALFAGFLGIPHAFGHSWIGEFLQPIRHQVHWPGEAHAGEAAHATQTEILFMAISSGIAVLGIALGFLCYRRGPERGEAIAQRLPAPYALLQGKYFIDEIYHAVVLEPLRLLSRLSARFDLGVIDALVDGVGRACAGLGRSVNRGQDGHLQTYGLWLTGGAVVMVGMVVYSFW